MMGNGYSCCFFLHRFDLDILNFDDYSMCGSKVLLNRCNNCMDVKGSGPSHDMFFFVSGFEYGVNSFYLNILIY